MATKCDNIVVGSGASGLTSTLLLAQQGRSVLLLEKASFVGGSLTRFRRENIPLDTGLHFAGGLGEGGLLDQMLRVLGVRDGIVPAWCSNGAGHHVIFESTGLSIPVTPGADSRARVKALFPNDASAIDRYFAMMRSVCERTTTMDLRRVSEPPESLDEDFVTLDETLRNLTSNEALRCFLSTYCMCHGVKPTEISFANHCRIVHDLHTSLARVEKGGDALVAAIMDRLDDLDVDVRLGTSISHCADVEGDRVGRFVLDSGESVECEECVLTMHPKVIIDLLPKDQISKAFIERVSSFERSVGFFAVYGVIDEGVDVSDIEPAIVSLFPTIDMNEMLDPECGDERALLVLTHRETVSGYPRLVVTAIELSFAEDVEAWKDSTTQDRPPEYMEYKRHRTERITSRILSLYPEFKDSFRLLEAATMLTFRDYLNSPEGTAYGVKQKIGQLNLVGQTRLRNVFVAGQSAVLPGIVGAMMSAFVVTRSIMGKDQFNRYIEERLAE